MVKDVFCSVQLGAHPTPYWIDKNSGVVVCTSHKLAMDEQAAEDPDGVEPFDWEPFKPTLEHRNIFKEKDDNAIHDQYSGSGRREFPT